MIENHIEKIDNFLPSVIDFILFILDGEFFRTITKLVATELLKSLIVNGESLKHVKQKIELIVERLCKNSIFSQEDIEEIDVFFLSKFYAQLKHV